MSGETIDWLNTQTRIGFAEKRGNAWHYRQGATNHYPGAVPMADVLDLFGFDISPREIAVRVADNEQGEPVYSPISGRVAWCRDDTGDVMGIFTDGYTGHGYRPWLVDNVETILSDDLAIGSAGLLRNGARAWVQVEMPDTITTPDGIEFRPNLLATTSYDGSLATTYKGTTTIVVCDNTREVALREDGGTFKVKHTRYSNLKLTDARAALGIVHTLADDFSQEVAELLATTVTDGAWEMFLNSLIPVPEDAGAAAITKLDNRRDALQVMYRTDPRVSPWTGTAYGVLMATNTYDQHSTRVNGDAPRWSRMMQNTLSGKYAKSDALTMEKLDAVLALA